MTSPSSSAFASQPAVAVLSEWNPGRDAKAHGLAILTPLCISTLCCKAG